MVVGGWKNVRFCRKEMPDLDVRKCILTRIFSIIYVYAYPWPSYIHYIIITYVYYYACKRLNRPYPSFIPSCPRASLDLIDWLEALRCIYLGSYTLLQILGTRYFRVAHLPRRPQMRKFAIAFLTANQHDTKTYWLILLFMRHVV